MPLMTIGAGRSLFMAPASTASEESETTAWVDAVVGDGGSVSNGRRTLVNDLIVSLKASGTSGTNKFSKIDRLWLYAAENTQSALRDIKAAAAATANGSPSFSADDGYTGTDGSTTVYVDTGFNANSAGGNYTQNSAHIGLWYNTNGTTARIVFSGRSGSGTYNCHPQYPGDETYMRINDVTSGGVANGGGDRRGHYLGNRSGASAKQIYKNASSLGTQTTASLAVPNENMIIFARDTGAGVDEGAGVQLSAVHVGGSLNSDEVTDVYNALRTYMTAVGVP